MGRAQARLLLPWARRARGALHRAGAARVAAAAHAEDRAMTRVVAVGVALVIAAAIYLEACYDAASACGPWWWRWSTPRPKSNATTT